MALLVLDAQRRDMKPFHFFLNLTILFALAACAPLPTTSPPQATPETNQPSASSTSPAGILVLVWERNGGFAGFCDKVTIYESGSADVINCKGNIKTSMQLTDTQRRQLDNWLKTLQPIDFAQSDPPMAADGMSVALALAGRGAQRADETTIGLISQFAAELASQAVLDLDTPPEKDAAAQSLREYLTALNKGDYLLGAKLYGGDTELLQTWNPDITNDLPKLFERACTQNGLVCLLPRTVTFRGLDADDNYQFLVEFTNVDGTFFVQGPCCGEENGPSFSNFLFRVMKTESGFVVLDLPPYVP
jgi:hypothetical protein